MINTIRILVYFVILVLVQVLVLNNIHFLRMATPFIYLYFIIKLPVGYTPSRVISLSFLIGLVIDIFSNTPGMHAAASTFVGFTRHFLLKFFKGDDLPETAYPSFQTFGVAGFIRFSFTFIFIHHLTLFLLESLTIFDPLFLLIRIVASVLMTTIFISIVEAFNVESQRSGE